MNGEFQELVGLDSVSTNDVVPQHLVFEQYLRADDAVVLHADARSQECIDKMYGNDLAQGLAALGFNKGVICLATEARDPGAVDQTYSGPDFGAGAGGSQSYDTTSTGGGGGACSSSTSMLCTVNGDCPSGETCINAGGSMALRYTIARLPN